MKFSFKSITKTLTEDAIEGGVLYAGVKGYKVANHLFQSLNTSFPFLAGIPSPIKNAGVALVYSAAVDMIAPKKYRSLIGAGAFMEAIASFVDPYVDPMLVKSNLIGLGSLSTASSFAVGIASGAIAPGTAAPMAGYGRVGAGMGGYATVRGAMGGYGQVGGYNMLGFPQPAAGLS